MTPPLIDKIFNTDRISDEEIFSVKNRIYSNLNPVSYLIAREEPDTFLNMDGIFTDGTILIRFINLIYKKKLKRRSADMTSLFAKLFPLTSGTFYFVGATQKEIEKSVSILKSSYSNLNIIGFRNGYFNSEYEIESEHNKILKLNPDFVLVGMGAPAQELFLYKLKQKGFKGIGISCGAFFSQLSANGMHYYPKWMNKLNMRFIYRFLKEKHTRKRYINAAFRFPVALISDILKFSRK